MNEKIKIIKSFLSMRYCKNFKSREELKKYQEKMILNQMRFIKNNCEFYKSIKTGSIDDFRKLPIINKKIMMDNFNKINTVGIDRDRALKIAINSEKSRDFNEKLNKISVGLSSGTSGVRGLFIVSDNERTLWAGGVLAKFLPRNNIFFHRIAFFLRADNNLYETIGSRIIKFKYFDIMKDMDDNIKKLDEYKPTILVAPPSVLLIISKYVVDKKINIKPIKIISVAEVLTEKDREYLLKVFNLKIIHQAYQCTEGFIGYVCEYGNFHINEDVIYLEKEYIGEKKFIPIITDFLRKSQPIIRYRLNDVLIDEDKECPCKNKSMLIKKIEGREDDIFIFKNCEGKDVIVFPDFISRCVIYTQGINNYRVVQKNEKNITVYIDNLDKKIKQNIVLEFIELSKKMNFILPNIDFKYYKVDLTKKMRRVEREK